jgi:hypothetical protein
MKCKRAYAGLSLKHPEKRTDARNLGLRDFLLRARMVIEEARAEYRKLEDLVKELAEVADRAQRVDLHNAERSIEGNLNNPPALEIIERNLRNIRALILSELAGVLKNGIDKNP